MRRLMKVFIFFVGTLIFVTTTQAAPFSYNESSSVDLVGLPAPTVFPFDIGVNSIIGTSYFSYIGQTNIYDFDSFAFSIPFGTQLTQVSYTFTVDDITGTTAKTKFRLDNGNQSYNSPYLGDITIDLTGTSPVVVFGAALPLGPDIYGMHNYEVVRLTDGGQWWISYQWDLTVEPNPVPEPTTMLLLGSGLIGLWGARKKFKR